MNRQTSLYTLTIRPPLGNDLNQEVDQVAALIPEMIYGRSFDRDASTVSVKVRVADDAAARAAFGAAISLYEGCPVRIHTGFGIHARDLT